MPRLWSRDGRRLNTQGTARVNPQAWRRAQRAALQRTRADRGRQRRAAEEMAALARAAELPEEPMFVPDEDDEEEDKDEEMPQAPREILTPAKSTAAYPVPFTCANDNCGIKVILQSYVKGPRCNPCGQYLATKGRERPRDRVESWLGRQLKLPASERAGVDFSPFVDRTPMDPMEDQEHDEEQADGHVREPRAPDERPDDADQPADASVVADAGPADMDLREDEDDDEDPSSLIARVMREERRRRRKRAKRLQADRELARARAAKRDRAADARPDQAKSRRIDELRELVQAAVQAATQAAAQPAPAAPRASEPEKVDKEVRHALAEPLGLYDAPTTKQLQTQRQTVRSYIQRARTARTRGMTEDLGFQLLHIALTTKNKNGYTSQTSSDFWDLVTEWRLSESVSYTTVLDRLRNTYAPPATFDEAKQALDDATTIKSGEQMAVRAARIARLIDEYIDAYLGIGTVSFPTDERRLQEYKRQKKDSLEGIVKHTLTATFSIDLKQAMASQAKASLATWATSVDRLAREDAVRHTFGTTTRCIRPT